MYKEISGREALKVLANDNRVFFKEGPSKHRFTEIADVSQWNIFEFLSPKTEYVFAVKIEPVIEINHFKIGEAADFITLHVSKFQGMEVKITVEQIE